MPARYVFLDEVDAYPASADEEGDPVGLAEARSLTFAHRRKLFLVSTPTIRGVSRIEREYEAADQRRYFVPCPHCGAMQWLRFERLRWEKGRPETAAYWCEHCERVIPEHHKGAMLAAGEWRATAVAQRSAHDRLPPVGALFAAGLEELGRHRARQGGGLGHRTRPSGSSATPCSARPGSRPARRRTGSGWPTGARNGAAGTVPAGGLFLTAGADVQKDRIEVDVWAWGRGLESWLVEHVVIAHGPGDPEAWAALDRLLGRTWPHARGAAMRLARLAIDTGYETSAVYAWSRRAGFAQVAPVKGVEGFNRASPVAGPTYVDVSEGGKRLRRGARLWTVAVSTFKAETYRFLRLERPARTARRSRPARCTCRAGPTPSG